MSSPAFRALVLGVLADQWTACPVYDLSDYTSVDDLPAQGENPLLGVLFGRESQRLATIATQGTHGWEADGSFFLLLFLPTGEPSQRALDLGEQVRALFRGKRFGSYVIDALDPFADFFGVETGVIGKWHRWVSTGSYHSVVCDGP
jgi:hypothetical protein